MEYILEKERKILVKGEYDVIVCGGGIAGISAALAAARQGAKTLLLEQTFLLGGLATAGLVTIYLPLCDGKGTQVSFSLAEELLKLSVAHGEEFSHLPSAKAWLTETPSEEEIALRKKQRYQTQFNASLYALLCEKTLLNAGVEILYGSTLCSAQTENGKVQSIIIENKGGRYALKAKSFVDATGDADLCLYAGAKTETFKQGNVVASWYYEHTGEEYRLHMLGFSDVPDKFKTEERIKNDTRKRYTGVDGTELSQMVCDAHENVLNDYLKNGGVSKTRALGSIATIPQIRMTRKLVGEYILDDTQDKEYMPDSIGMVSDWRKSGPIYEIPFGCLYGKEIKNLTVCGRCISVTDDMWDITRVIPDCAVTGEAAGIAAAICDDMSLLDISILQQKLQNNGVKLHIKDLNL